MIVTLNAGECFVVPKGIEHKTVAPQEAHVLFIEKAGTLNTGENENTERTVTTEEWI
jgi:mannose-6-phosphate isomerase-like protein (cupin superfamily)